MSDETFDQWAILELMGHRRVAGRVREVQVAGAGFLRLDIPATEGHGPQTQYISPGSVYAMHPTTEEIATAAAANFRPAPVSRWELEPAKTQPQMLPEDYDEDVLDAAERELEDGKPCSGCGETVTPVGELCERCEEKMEGPF